MDEWHLERAQWRKSSYSSANGACVEVARNLPGIVAVRDSKNPEGLTLILTRADWQVFLASFKAPPII
jgi:hypothetical protein